MKYPGLLGSIFWAFAAFGQGNNCNNPYFLISDGVYRNYAISSGTGLAQHCTDSVFSGTGHVTVFSFTTDASGSCVLINLTTSGYQPAEALLYTKCSGGGALQTLETASSVCFNDGTGLWAPSETLVLSPNKIYYLRIWTRDTGTLTLSTINYNPPNNFCAGATLIGPVALDDNNACNKPSTEVLPSQLCAFTLENTAFYKFIVDTTGVSVLMINRISCDNSAAGATAGFQIGFFKGSCGSLVPINCYAAVGGSVSATTASLPGGTQVIVAIDGMSGSNCSYSISAFNAFVLPATIRYFSAWTGQDANILRWVTVSETPDAHFEIEKSGDGQHFISIGTQQGLNNSGTATDYSFSDRSPWPDQFYRLGLVNAAGRSVYSNILHVKRNDLNKGSRILQNPAFDQLLARIISLNGGTARIQVLDVSGRVLKSETARLLKGENFVSLDISRLPKGVYLLTIPGENQQAGFSFIKQ